MTEITTGIRHDALDVPAALAAASSPDCGGIAAFVVEKGTPGFSVEVWNEVARRESR